jgi:hypothetical protein
MRVTYMQCYGKACYEMSGERYRESLEFKEFILDVLKIRQNELGGDNKIPMPLRYELVQGVMNGRFGNSYGISYDDIKIDKEDVTKRELLNVFNDIYINYDAMDYLRNKELEDLLSI